MQAYNYTNGWVGHKFLETCTYKNMQCFTTYTIATKTIHACEQLLQHATHYTISAGMFVTALVHVEKKIKLI